MDPYCERNISRNACGWQAHWASARPKALAAERPAESASPAPGPALCGPCSARIPPIFQAPGGLERAGTQFVSWSDDGRAGGNNLAPTLLHLRPRLCFGAEDGWRRLGGRRSMERVQRGGILRNLHRRSARGVAACQISVAPRSRTHRLVTRAAMQRARSANSFPFFTGVCEKESSGAVSVVTLSRRSQRVVAEKGWNDCACAL